MGKKLRSVKNINVKGKRVLLRADLDVPLDKKGKITDDTRLKDSVLTIKHLISRKAKIIIIGHLGRPGGKRVRKFAMDNVAKRLSKVLGKKVKKIDDSIGEKAQSAVENMRPGDVVLLENPRFHAGEEKNSSSYAKSLAGLADVYVNDAFASWRKHASVHMITKYLPSYAGLFLEKEVNALEAAVKTPKKPFVVVLGGLKVTEKIGTVKNLLKMADKVMVGGAMVFTFYKARGYEVGTSVIDKSSIKEVKKLVKNKKLVLASDVVVSKGKKSMMVKDNEIPKGWKAVDIGSESIETFVREIKKAKTVLWNGPMGVFEEKVSEKGTKQIAKALAASKAKTIVGGGHTIEACIKYRLLNKFKNVASGGGAMLEFLAGKKLPGVEALRK